MNDLRSIFPEYISTARPLVIAGPCSAETEEQVLSTARQLAAEGVHVFRAGIWKPRTKPGCFEGVGAVGLEWLRRVRRETGMKVATEVATREHVALALEAGVDLVWIGARTTANPFAIQELADALGGSDLPVLVKNPVSPDVDLWIGALERLYNAGLRRLAAIHRGFPTLGKTPYRNQPMWSIPIELRRRLPELPILGDPSHMGGRRDLVESLAQQAMDLGFDGLIIESHCTPGKAWSDSAQQVTPSELRRVLDSLVIRDVTASGEELVRLRAEIDEVDDQLVELLHRRMTVSRKIGRYKKQHAMSILQTDRYKELLAHRSDAAEALGMDRDFMESVLRIIHEESIRQQMEIIEKK